MVRHVSNRPPQLPRISRQLDRPLIRAAPRLGRSAITQWRPRDRVGDPEFPVRPKLSSGPWTAARVACMASSTRSLRSLTLTPPTLITATPPASLERRSLGV